MEQLKRRNAEIPKRQNTETPKYRKAEPLTQGSEPRQRWRNHRTGLRLGLVAAAVHALSVGAARGDEFPGYQFSHTFTLPAGATVFDVLNDGRLIVLVGDDVYVESAAGSDTFSQTGTLPNADFPSYGPAFVRVSPDGSRIAVGNNGGASFSSFKIGVFDIAALTGTWFSASHLDAEWIDNTQLAITAGDFLNPSLVTVLDTASVDPQNPTNPVVVNGIGGASGGIAFDFAGKLYTGNGFQTSGPSGTGAVKAFAYAAWTAALSGGPPLNFETDGILVVDILSASPLGFDGRGNLFIGGGDFSSNADFDFVALVRASAVAEALSGMGAVDPDDPNAVRRLDPDKANGFNFFSANYNSTLHRLYMQDGGSTMVHVYADVSTIPTVSQWGLVTMTLLLMTAGTLILRRSQVGDGV